MPTPDTISGAVHRLYAASGVSTSLTGGLWTGEVPEGTSLPYGWLEVSDVVTSPTFEQQFEAAKLVVHLYAAGAANAEGLAQQWKDAFDYQTLSFRASTTSSIMLLPRRYQLRCEMVRWKDSSLVYRATLTYHALVQKSR